MAVTNNNNLVVGTKETKDVISLAILIAKAIKASQEDGVFDFKDIPNFLPVLFAIGPAITGIENIQVELKVLDAVEADELKSWIRTQMPDLIEDAKLDKFIQDCFAIALDMWVVYKNYFFPTPAVEPAVGNESAQ